jgi:hypothetical protein
LICYPFGWWNTQTHSPNDQTTIDDPLLREGGMRGMEEGISVDTFAMFAKYVI